MMFNIESNQQQVITMFDFKSHFAIVKSVAQETAKAMHKPSLSNKQSMADYAKAVGATGKAVFIEEDKNQAMQWSV